MADGAGGIGPVLGQLFANRGRATDIGIDRRHGLIRTWKVTDAARHDGAQLPELIDKNNTAGDVWADTAYRSKANETFLAGRLMRSQIHHKKPKGRPMPRRSRQRAQISGALGGRARLRSAESKRGFVPVLRREGWA